MRAVILTNVRLLSISLSHGRRRLLVHGKLPDVSARGAAACTGADVSVNPAQYPGRHHF